MSYLLALGILVYLSDIVYLYSSRVWWNLQAPSLNVPGALVCIANEDGAK
jgi:hypothetical protein